MDPMLRLPAIRDMVDNIPAAHDQSAQPQARGTASLWTAINHQPDTPSPPTPNRNIEADPSPRQRLDQQRENPSAEIPIIDPNRRSSPFFAGEHQTAGKPIIAGRQDSAVYPSASWTATTTLSRDSTTENSPESRDTTSPSVPSSSQSHPAHSSALPTTHDRQLLGLPFTGLNKQENDHSNSHRRHRSQSDLTGSTKTPTVPVENGRNSMPPPPIPAPASALPSESAERESSPSSPSTVAPQSSSRTQFSLFEFEQRPERCAYCHATWTFPPPDARSLDVGTSHTPTQMNNSMDAITALLSDYRARKDADYEGWKYLHRGGHCQCRNAQSGCKRKADEPRDDGSLPSKSRKTSSHSPPRRSRSPPTAEYANSANGETTPGKFYFKPKDGPSIPVSDHIAAMLQIDGAPVPRHHTPLTNDSHNMWYDQHRKSGRINGQEEASISRRKPLAEETAH